MGQPNRSSSQPPDYTFALCSKGPGASDVGVLIVVDSWPLQQEGRACTLNVDVPNIGAVGTEWEVQLIDY